MLRSVLDYFSYIVDLIRGLIQLVIMIVKGLIDLLQAIVVLPGELPVMLGWLPPAAFTLFLAGVTITIIKLVVGRDG